MYRYVIMFETGKKKFTVDVADTVHGMAKVHGITGFTLNSTFGLFEGKVSTAYRLEIIGSGTIRPLVAELAENIRERWNQDEVWSTAEPISLTISSREQSYTIK